MSQQYIYLVTSVACTAYAFKDCIDQMSFATEGLAFEYAEKMALFKQRPFYVYAMEKHPVALVHQGHANDNVYTRDNTKG